MNLSSMCFIPFLAARSAPKLVPHNEHPPGIALHPLEPDLPVIRDKFSLPHVADIKLVIGCGCWLRHVGNKPHCARVEDIVGDPKYDPSNEQPKHDALADFLQLNFQQDGQVEFFGCNDGEYDLPATERLELPVDAMRHRHFHFRVGTVYRFTFQETECLSRTL